MKLVVTFKLVILSFFIINVGSSTIREPRALQSCEFRVGPGAVCGLPGYCECYYPFQCFENLCRSQFRIDQINAERARTLTTPILITPPGPITFGPLLPETVTPFTEQPLTLEPLPEVTLPLGPLSNFENNELNFGDIRRSAVNDAGQQAAKPKALNSTASKQRSRVSNNKKGTSKEKNSG